MKNDPNGTPAEKLLDALSAADIGLYLLPHGYSERPMPLKRERKVEHLTRALEATTTPGLAAINVIISEHTTEPHPLFVEIENDEGQSVEGGQRIEREDGLTAIRITAADLATTPRILTDAAEIDALPDRTVVLDKFGDVLQYRSGLWCSYESAELGSEWITRKCAPLTVIYTPEAR